MVIDVRKPLFTWDEMHSSPTLGTVRQALEAISDAPLSAALQARRHNGCDTYPVRVLWGVLLPAILRRHAAEACLETRFFAVLGQSEHLKLMRGLECRPARTGTVAC